MGVIAFLNENIFAIRAAIVDVIVGVVEEWRWTGHVGFRPKVFFVISRHVGQGDLAYQGSGWREKPLGSW